MKKKSLCISIAKFLISIFILVYLGMIYWSNNLIEKDLIEIKDRVDRLESKPRLSRQFTAKKAVFEAEGNLLSEDLYYKNVLPEILGSEFVPSGTLRNSVMGRPKSLEPFSPWYQANVFLGMCNSTLASQHFGIYDTLGPSLAVRLEERVDPKSGEPEYWAFLREDAFWSPLTSKMFNGRVELSSWFLKKHLVTAHDVKFFYDLMMNPFNQEPKAVTLRTYYRDLEHVEVIDDYTLKIRWKSKDVGGVKRAKYMSRSLTAGLQALPSFVFQYFSNGEKIIEGDDFRTSSLFAQNFSNHFARNVIPSSGVWSFDTFTDKNIEFSRNDDYFNPFAALVNKRIISFKDGADAPWQDFKALNSDYTSLNPDQVIELKQFKKSPLYKRQLKNGLSIERLDYLSRSFSYIGWNAKKPYFKSARVRQALTHAIDRDRIINGILNGMGKELTGPFFIDSSEYNKTLKPLEYSPKLARQILDEENWFDTDGDGVRQKKIDGVEVPFRFYLTYYVKSNTIKAVCEQIQTDLKEVGIDVRLKGVDISDLSQETDDKSFDALYMAWALGAPPSDPRQIWFSKGADQKGSSNLVSFKNAEADKIIEALDYEYDLKARERLYHRFHKIIYEEQPYTFLYIPKAILLYRSNVGGVFIPSKRQDLIPGADVSEPQSENFWLKS